MSNNTITPIWRRRVAGAAIAPALFAGSLVGAGTAQASPETSYLQLLNESGFVVYNTSAALGTGYAICEALNTTTGDVVARNLYLHTTSADIPDIATADAWVIIAGSTLCPWQFHPERLPMNNRMVRA